MEDLGTFAKQSQSEPRPELDAVVTEKQEPVSGISIGDYLIRRLLDYRVNDLFGIPGDYTLSFYSKLEESPINVVGCTREDNAGFAADAYARVHGIGAICVTYAVGGLSACNAVAGAYAEKSPVIVISGSPGKKEQMRHPLLHHRVRDFRTQLEVYHRLCVASTVLDDADLALREIDRVLEAVVRYRRPGYIELPRDMVDVVPEGIYRPVQARLVSDPGALEEATGEARRRLAEAKRPCILAGVEIHRFGLQKRLLKMAESLNLPIATTLLGKSVIAESHPLFAGVYEGAMGREDVTRFVEESDLVFVLGAFVTDLNLGIYTAKLDPTRCIYATSELLRISHHRFDGVLLSHFIQSLTRSELRAEDRALPATRTPEPLELKPENPITVTRLMRRLNASLDASTIVIADVGDSLFAAADLIVREQTDFMSPAYYATLGFAVPAALGVLTARPDLRPIVIAGDGGFQMTATELGTMTGIGLAPIVIVLDNKGYGTERILHPGEHKFNDIHPWRYHELPRVFGGGTGYEIHTEGQFDQALRAAIDDTSGPAILHVHIAGDDWSDALKRLGKALGSFI